MAFVPVPDCAKVAIRGHLDSQLTINTLHFRRTGGYTAATLALLANAIDTWYDTFIQPNLSSSWSFSDVTVTDIAVDGGAQAVEATRSGSPGGRGSQSMPGNVALCISFRTALTGRSNRGRNYIPAVPQDRIVPPNQVNETYRTNLVTGYGELLTLGTGDDWVIVSRQHNNVHLAVGVANPVVSVLTIDNVVDSMRRRLPGRGA